MVNGVASVWLPVSDMKRAVGFYRDILGLEVVKSDDDWTELDANGLMIGLNGREEVSGAPSGGAVITFQPEGGDLDREVGRLETDGVPFIGGISEHPWGRIAAFKDTEGNDLQLYAPPSS